MAEPSLVRYLRAAGELPEAERRSAVPAGFVTISRQPGAGGRELAKAIIREMEARGDPGWTVFDANTFRRAVHDAHLETPSRLADEERYEGFFGDLFNQFMGGAGQDAVMRAAFRTMRKAAERGRVIFLGRGAVCVARDVGGIHLRLVASRSSRLIRLASRYAVSEREAQRLERDIEASRRRFFRWHFQREIDDPLLYDLVLNTDTVPAPDAARLVVELLARRVAAEAA